MDFETIQAYWTDLYNGWSTELDAQYQAFVSAWLPEAEALGPEDAAEAVTNYIAWLDLLGADIADALALVDQLPAEEQAAERALWEGYATRYDLWGAGFWPFVQLDEAPASSVQGAPLVLAVPVAIGVLIVTPIALAYIVGSVADVETTTTNAHTERLELQARVEAMRMGTSLQASTLPKPPDDKNDKSGGGWLVGLVGVALFGGLAWMWKGNK
ncbi:hypothetical protein L6R46_04380 [Myxococcota bacterium]|nr:hypothetical protein [Myxococcota bacterium]